MSILQVDNLNHSFGDRVILEDVSFRMNKGEHIGLVGPNGEGKSTFLKVITRQMEVDEGKILWAKNVKVGYLDQHATLKKGMTIRDVLQSAFEDLFDMEAHMNDLYMQMSDENADMDALMNEASELQDLLNAHDFYTLDAKIDEVSRALGIFDLGLDKDVQELSGGQRTKILLAKLLLEKPDILLLDEPTNYLDVQHIQWLEKYLMNYENAFLLISHDLPFLNKVVNVIYHIHDSQLNRYPGNYDNFVEVYEMQKAQKEAAYKRQQKEIADLKDFVARNKARVATRNMAMSRQKKLDAMELIELEREKPKPHFDFKLAKTPSKVIFEASDLVIGYDSPLSTPIHFELERKQKVVLTGANGIGKTTLLKSLLGKIPSIEGKVEEGDNVEVAYFQQEESASDKTCLQEIWDTFPSWSQYEVRNALAKCGLLEKHIESKMKVLSGGEQAKVRLCKLMHQPSNVLVLDEPTNHLDEDAKNELQLAFQAYEGSILMVCHEPYFYEGFADKIINCEEWTTKQI